MRIRAWLVIINCVHRSQMQAAKDASDAYARTATIHGLAHFGIRGIANWKRALWIAAFISCIIMLNFNIVELVKRYTKMDKETTTKIIFGEHPFPAVTVCSQNGFKRSQAIIHPEIRELFTAAQAATGHIDNARLRELAATKFNLTANIEGMIMRQRVENELSFFIRQLTDEKKDQLTFTYGELIKSCAFNSGTCGMDDFTPHLDIAFGMCYSFNFEGRSVKRIARAGPNYGLKLFLFTNISEYVSTATSSGIRVVIHDQDHYPFPDTYGYNVPPKVAASFSVRPTRNERIVYGDTRCNDEVDPFYLYPGTVYSIEGCQRTCFQREAEERCGCSSPRYRKNDHQMSSARYCLPNNTAARHCLDQLESESTICDCPIRCTERTFDVDISIGSWRPEAGRTICQDQASCDDLLESGMLVSVYFENLDEKIIAEVPSYPIINLMSDCAGQFGFWIGLSFLGVIELILFLFSMAKIAAVETRRWFRQIRAPKLPPPIIFKERTPPPIFYFGSPIMPHKQRKWINAPPQHVEDRLKQREASKRHKLSSQSLENLSADVA